jgi:hypothetical protein
MKGTVVTSIPDQPGTWYPVSRFRFTLLHLLDLRDVIVTNITDLCEEVKLWPLMWLNLERQDVQW